MSCQAASTTAARASKASGRTDARRSQSVSPLGTPASHVMARTSERSLTLRRQNGSRLHATVAGATGSVLSAEYLDSALLARIEFPSRSPVDGRVQFTGGIYPAPGTSRSERLLRADLVAGASGVIGAPVTRRLVLNGHEVFGTTRRADR